MKVQNLRRVTTDNLCQVSRCRGIEMRCICQHLKRNILQTEKLAHFRSRLFQKAKHALPILFAKLSRKFARKCFGSSDSEWPDSEDRNYRLHSYSRDSRAVV